LEKDNADSSTDQEQVSRQIADEALDAAEADAAANTERAKGATR
jgi:hypothetical protein